MQATINVKSSIPAGTSGEWKVEKFTVPEFSIEALRLVLKGRPIVPGDYTKLTHRGYPVMSDTPAELRDLLPLVSAVNAMQPEKVLMNGLGLGIAILCILPCPSIKHIDIVERSTDVMWLVARHLPEKHRISIHYHDAYTKEWVKGTRWDIVWHDIWTNIPTEEDKADITRLKRKYARRCKWQGVWAEKEHKRIPRVHKQMMNQFYKRTGIDKAMKLWRKKIKAGEMPA